MVFLKAVKLAFLDEKLTGRKLTVDGLGSEIELGHPVRALAMRARPYDKFPIQNPVL